MGSLMAEGLPAPQPIAVVQTDMRQPFLAPNVTTMGNYKGAMAVMKFKGAVGARYGLRVRAGNFKRIPVAYSPFGGFSVHLPPIYSAVMRL